MYCPLYYLQLGKLNFVLCYLLKHRDGIRGKDRLESG